MGLFVFIMIPVGVSVLSALLACRRLTSRFRPLGFLTVFVTASIGPTAFLVYMVIVERDTSFTADYWLGNAKPGAFDILIPTTGILFAAALAANSLIAYLHDRKCPETENA